jgi:hypothetical protein
MSKVTHASKIFLQMLTKPEKSGIMQGMSRRRSFHHRDSQADSFRCAHCHLQVSANPSLAGVQNRNHCPYCLWSRHVDAQRAGDRLASCGAEMKPVGLTLKATRKKYGPAKAGELMLIHQCQGCGKLSINRIAADDAAERLLEVFRRSFDLPEEQKALLAGSAIELLLPEDELIVTEQLFGKGYAGRQAD